MPWHEGNPGHDHHQRLAAALQAPGWICLIFSKVFAEQVFLCMLAARVTLFVLRGLFEHVCCTAGTEFPCHVCVLILREGLQYSR